ncbi:MAG: hypothetical protein RLZ47_298 [Bacteroidota bacterium]|jgi:hypothetical protein
METIKITKQSRSYQQIDSLVIIVAALATSLDYRNQGAANYNPGDYIVAVGKSTNKMVRFPIFGPVEAALINKKPDQIAIVVEEIAPSKHNYNKTITVLSKTLDHVFLPFLIDFYESNIKEATGKFGDFKTNSESWPDSWQMGWVVRNAIAHNHKIDFRDKNSKPRTWSGVTISKENDGEPIADFFNSADLIILLLEMEKSLK